MTDIIYTDTVVSILELVLGCMVTEIMEYTLLMVTDTDIIHITLVFIMEWGILHIIMVDTDIMVEDIMVMGITVMDITVEEHKLETPLSTLITEKEVHLLPP